jgi:uncharacterized protein YbcI
MDHRESTMVEQLAEAASAFQLQQTGHAPSNVTVVLGEDTVVVTLHEALTPAELALASSPERAANLREFHQQLFRNSVGSLQKDIERITGREVREAATEIASGARSSVDAFSTGTIVQVFLLVPLGTGAIGQNESASR